MAARSTIADPPVSGAGSGIPRITLSPATPRITTARPHESATRPGHGIPLEPFQRLMLAWEESHPYNAAHMVKLFGPAHAPKLRAAISQVLSQTDIGWMCVDKAANRLRFEPGREPIICVSRCEGDIEPASLTILARAMNVRFPDGPHDPFRWILLEDNRGRSHVIVLVYHHVVSDGRGIQVLLKSIIDRYTDTGPVDAPPALASREPMVGGEKRRRIGPAGFVRAYLRAVRLHFRIMASYRMPEAAERGYETGVTALRAPSSLVHEITRTCAAHGVGFNDACLAALASALADITRQRRTRRLFGRRIALGTIMSTRRDDGNARPGLGVRLGGLVIIVPNPDAPIDDVLYQVSRETYRLKANRNAAQQVSAILAFFARRVLPFLGIPNSREAYRFIFPLCAGVSTLFVGDSSDRDCMCGVGRYVRISPPGPAMPIVLSPTVLEDDLELSLTYRRSCLSAQEADRVLEFVMKGLCDLSSDRPDYGHV